MLIRIYERMNSTRITWSKSEIFEYINLECGSASINLTQGLFANLYSLIPAKQFFLFTSDIQFKKLV